MIYQTRWWPGVRTSIIECVRVLRQSGCPEHGYAEGRWRKGKELTCGDCVGSTESQHPASPTAAAECWGRKGLKSFCTSDFWLFSDRKNNMCILNIIFQVLLIKCYMCFSAWVPLGLPLTTECNLWGAATVYFYQGKSVYICSVNLGEYIYLYFSFQDLLSQVFSKGAWQAPIMS